MNLQHLLDMIFPPQCGGCEQAGTGACESCVPRGATQTRALRTLDVCALGPYEGRLRKAVIALKSGRRDVAAAFAARLQEALPSSCILVPVPTTAARRRERGFDGCELLARLVARGGGVTTMSGLAQARGDRQRGRTREQRLAARGRFRWRGESLRGLRVTLLDDVVTTGATLEDCAAVLRAQGALVEQAYAIALT